MIFIPGSVPSLKNSKIVTMNGLFPSKTVAAYLREMGIQSYSVTRKEVKGFVRRDNEFQKYCNLIQTEMIINQVIDKLPLVMGFHFVRKSKHKFDFHNAVQILADLMVAHKLIADDDMDTLIPIPFIMNDLWYSYNKTNPGVFVKVYRNFKIE